MMSSLEYLLLETEGSFTKYVSSCPNTKYICIYGYRFLKWRRFIHDIAPNLDISSEYDQKNFPNDFRSLWYL